MADRYWVGGTANWDGTAGTKWATSSGGTGGASVPTSADDVFFTNLSTGTCTIATGNTGAKSINCTGFTGTLTGTAAISVAGSLTFVSGMGYTYTGTTTITGTGTITNFGGFQLSSITINGTGITVTLGSAITLATGRTFTLTNGTFDTSTSNYGFACDTFTVATGTKTLRLNGSQVAIFVSWNVAQPTNFTFVPGTSKIRLNGSSISNFIGGGLSYYDVEISNITGGSFLSFTGANSFRNLDFNANGFTGICSCRIAANQIVTGTLSTSSSAPDMRVFLFSDVLGTARTFTTAASSVSDIDFRDITIAGAAAPISGTRLGNCSGNSGITFPAAKTVYWNLTGSQNWSTNGWATSSGGTPAVNNFPLAQDTAVIDNAGAAGTITINAPWNIGAVDMSNRTSVVTLALNSNQFIYGNWTNGSGTAFSSTGTLSFFGRTTQSITSEGKTFSGSILISSFGGTVQLVDDLTVSAAASLTLTNGTFNANNQNVSVGLFASSNSNTRTLTMGSGTWTLSGTGIVWNTGTTTNLTFNVNTANIVLSNTSGTGRTFTGGQLAFNKLTIGGTTGTSTLQIDGSTTLPSFTEIASTKTVAHTITLNAGNISVANWTVTGTAGNVVTVNSLSPTVQRNIIYTGSGTISMDYMSIRDINFSYTLGASNPYLVYAGANSTNGGNNNGILFQPTTVKAYRLTTGTSWTVPADWNNSNNTIHMIGAGGGGATAAVSGNNRAAGGGGGGGGYTVLTNQTLTGAIPYTIGTSAGNASGGSTTFNTTNTAGGGSVGTATTTPTSSGGAGGAGTFAGGTGGVGGFGTAASTGYGSGGGGGAGGSNGIGGTGGNGVGGLAGTITGGGGGGNGGGSNGTNGTSGVGGNGGNNFGGTGGATGGAGSGANGTLGGGGAGGGSGSAGGQGGAGIDIANTIGGGGGKGGQGGLATAVTTNTGIYGGGGAGGGIQTAGAFGTGGAGSQGVIFIIYTPGGASVANSNFFLMFG
jgi:hypothetical protein